MQQNTVLYKTDFSDDFCLVVCQLLDADGCVVIHGNTYVDTIFVVKFIESQTF